MHGKVTMKKEKWIYMLLWAGGRKATCQEFILTLKTMFGSSDSPVLILLSCTIQTVSKCHTWSESGESILCWQRQKRRKRVKLKWNWILSEDFLFLFDFEFYTFLKPYHPVDPDIVFRLLGPGWQVNITNHCPVLPHAQVVAVAVHKHLREVVELWNQLLHFEKERCSCFTAHWQGHI